MKESLPFNFPQTSELYHHNREKDMVLLTEHSTPLVW